MKVMSKGAAVILKGLHENKQFDGIIGMGGSGGTSVITVILRDARPHTLYTVWVRLLGVDSEGNPYGGSPLTGIPVMNHKADTSYGASVLQSVAVLETVY